MRSTRELVEAIPQTGAVDAIVVRPGRREPAVTIESTTAIIGKGLADDRHAVKTRPGERRHVTLIQAEHLPVIASLLGGRTINATDLRRNLVISGINLLGTSGRTLQVGGAVIEVTGPCHPCSRMEEALGEGGFQAMRGHGGMTGRIITGGTIILGDRVHALDLEPRPTDTLATVGS